MGTDFASMQLYVCVDGPLEGNQAYVGNGQERFIHDSGDFEEFDQGRAPIYHVYVRDTEADDSSEPVPFKYAGTEIGTTRRS